MGEAILIGFGLFCLLIVVSVLVKIFYKPNNGEPQKCEDCKMYDLHELVGKPIYNPNRKCTCNKKPS